MTDAVIDIYQLSTTTKKSYSRTDQEVRAVIVPASNEAIAMFDSMPQGQPFEFRILSDDILNLKQQSKLVVIYPQVSGFDEGDTFITVADTKRQRMMGRYYLTGTCCKVE